MNFTPTKNGLLMML